MSIEIQVTEVIKAVKANRQKSPLFASEPAAGFPAPSDDLVEKVLDINDLVVKNPASTFFVRVRGDSMEGAGIFSGDVLVVDRAVEAKGGNILVAAINGEMVVKRLKITQLTKNNSIPTAVATGGSRVELVSENDEYEPIEIGEDEDCFVWGVVVGSVRQFD